MKQNPSVLKIGQASKALGVSIDTLRRWEASGKIQAKRTTGGTRVYSPFVKIGEAAKILGVSIDTLRRWERSGKIAPVRTPGSTRLYSLEEISRLQPSAISPQTNSESLTTDSKASLKTDDYQHFSHPIALETLINQKLDERLKPSPDFQDLVESTSKPKKIYAKIYAGAALCLILALLLIGPIGLIRQIGPIGEKPKAKIEQPISDVLAVSSIAQIGKFLEINADTVITGNMAVNGESVFGEGIIGKSTLSISGVSTLSTTSVNSSFSVTGLSTLTGGLTTPGKITLTNNAAETMLIKPASDPSSATKLFVIKNAADSEKVSIDSSGATILSSTLKVSGATTLSSTISVSGATTLSSSLEVSGTSTLSGAVIGSAAGAASTPGLKLTGAWYTGGSATTTKPQLLVEPTDITSTGWSTSGTGIGVNAKSSFTGNLIDLQVAGTSKFKVDYAGNMTSGGTFLAADGTVSAPAYSFSADTDTGIYRSGTNILDFTSGGVRTLTLATATSGVNYISITPAATGSGPTLASAGSDTNIPLNLNSAGTGSIVLTSANATGGTTSSAFVMTANSLTSGTGLYLSSTGTLTGTLASLVANSATTGTVLNLSATGLTTGKAINIDTTHTPTAGGTQSVLDLNFTNAATSTANTLRGIDIALTDATSLANTLYGIYVNTDVANTAATKYAAGFVGGTVLQTPTNPTYVGGIDMTDAREVVVSGRYAYIVKSNNTGACSSSDKTGCEMQIWDVTTPSSPTFLGGADIVGRNGISIRVYGRYAYIGGSNVTGTCSSSDKTGCEMQIWDISNPTNPAYIGGADTLATAFSPYIYGKYAYIVTFAKSGTCSTSDNTGCELQVWDISNPTSPTFVGGGDTDPTSGSFNGGFFTSGRYVYITLGAESGTCSTSTNVGCELQIWDLANPIIPTFVGGVDLGTSGSGFSKVFVSGRYAYLTSNGGGNTTNCSSNCQFYIYDISNPASPTSTGSISTGSTALGEGIFVIGKYAYLLKGANTGTCSSSDNTGCEVQAYDVSNPASPTYVGGADKGDTTNDNWSTVFIEGRYLFAPANANTGTCSSTNKTGCELQIYDISGVEATSVMAHSLESGSLQVRDNGIINNQLTVGGGLGVGIGGIQSQGSVSSYVTSSSTTADTLLALDLSTTHTGAISTGTKSVYGIRSQPSSAGATDTGGTINTYGGYYSATGAAGGTSNAYGLWTTATGADNNYGLEISAISNAGSGTNYGIDIGNLSGATTAVYGIKIGTLTGGAGSSVYGISTGALTSVASGTNYQVDLGTVAGATSATFGAINTGAISGAGTTSYGINVGANTSTATTNYGLYLGAVSGGTTNYSIYTNGGSVYHAPTQTVASAASATLDAFNIPASTITVSGITNITTATGFNLVNIGQPTYSNASIAISNAATLYIANAPTASGGGSITNPYALWVDAGNVRLDGTVIYQGTSTYIHNYGTNNFFAGVGAGNLTLTGNQNTVVGDSAGTALTTGQFNTFLGAQAGNGNTSGNSNVFIGRFTATTNTTGGNNIAIGYNSNAGTTGGQNTVVGDASGTAITSGTYNTYIGAATGISSTTGGYNTALGGQALNQSTGANNTATGYYALRANTSASNNTATGYNALAANTTGTPNVAMGTYALTSNTTGARNSSLGYAALYTHTTGNDNTALGYEALYNNTTSSDNTAVGSNALFTNSTGALNTAFGSNSVYSNTTGTRNVGLGYQSLYYNQTGNDNVAVGYRAGLGTSTNSYSSNSLFGTSSGLALTTGSNNILLGFQAGDAITSGANNIVIGYDIDAPSATASNQMSIGNLIFATAVDGTGTTLSTGSVGIRVAAPAATLDILAPGATTGFNLAGTAPASVAGNGTSAATNTLLVVGTAGGASSGITGQTGGTGGALSLTAGVGGAVAGASGIGGVGGGLTLAGGAGGNGAATGGAGGAISITAGAAGTGGNANGGTLTLNSGAVTGTGTSTINLGSSNTTNLNIGTAAVADTITIGNATGATSLALTSGTGSQTHTSSVATGTTTTSAFVFTDSALTSGTGLYAVSSSITTGKLIDIATSGNTWTGNGTTNGLVNLASTSTAGTASSSDILLNIARSGANAQLAHTAYGIYSNVTNTNATSGTNVAGYFSATGATTANYGVQVAAMTGATSTGLDIGALSGTTANKGINIGAISGALGTGAGVTVGNISTTGATNYGIQLGTMTGGTTSNYQISTGVLTSATTTTNAQLNLGGVVTTGGTTNYGINVGALSGSGTTNYGINITALTSTGTTNYGLNIGGATGAATTNYGIYLGAVSGATTNYTLYAAGGNSYFATTQTVASAASATLDAFNIPASTITVSGSTNITTATGFNLVNLGQPTYSNASIAVTNAATLYIANAPTASGGGSITNPYALWVDAGDIRSDGVILAADGSASAPSITFNGDADTGIFHSTNLLRLTSGGAEAIRIDQANLDFYQTAPNNGTYYVQFTPAALTGVTGQKQFTLYNSASLTITGGYASQIYHQFNQPSITAASSLTVGTAVTFQIAGAPTVSSSAIITNTYGLQVGRATSIAGAAATTYGAIDIPAHTVTDVTTTQITSSPAVAGMRIGQITVAQSGGAVTVDNAASLYIAAAPTAGASVTLTNPYSLWVDAGTSRFDGDLQNGDGTTTTTKTGPFLYLNTTAGAPTGTPTGITGTVATTYDTTNNKLCAYNTAWKCTAALADIAEWVPAAGAEAGDLVSVTNHPNPTPDSTAPFMLGKSTISYDPKMVGVISQYAEEANSANGYKLSPDYHAMTLAGRVPVKVSTENGPIEKGDYLTSSSTPGVAMKATNPGPVIGKALESFNGTNTTNQTNRILVFVNVSWADPGQALANLLLDEAGNLVIPKVKTASLQISPISPIGQIGQEQESALDVASKLKVINEQIATQSATLAELVTKLEASASASLNLTPPEVLLATGSATLANLKVTETLSSEKLLTALDVTVSGIFKALGEAILPATTIAGQLVVDGTFSISSNSINAIGLNTTNLTNQTNGILYLQNNSLAQGLDILNGKFIFDKEGRLTVAGVVEAEQFSITSGKSAGTGKILAGQTESIIENEFVTENSIILITPDTPLSQTLAVTNKSNKTNMTNAKFTVKLNHSETQDITFSYLIIGQNKSNLTNLSNTTNL